MKPYLLATVSGIVLIGAAQAADLPVAFKAAPMESASWAGFYLGVQGGAARHEASFNDLDGFVEFGGLPATQSTSKTGGLFGGYAGYNWQDRSFVYGVESDISWGGAKADSQLGGRHFSNFTFKKSHVFPGPPPFRAGAGLDFESTLIYV